MGCGPQSGTAVGNGKTVSLNLSGYEKTGATTQALTLASGIEIEAVYMAIDRVRLVPGEDCDGDDEIDLDGPFVAELTEGGIIGDVPSFATDEAAFCSVRVGYHRVEADKAPAGTPAEMIDLSLHVRGTLTDGTGFTVSSQRNDRFELDAREGTFALPAGGNLLFLAYEIGSWIDALGLSTLGPGPIVIDEDENSDALKAFEDAVEASALLFRDDDDDGQLGPDERVAPLAQ